MKALIMQKSTKMKAMFILSLFIIALIWACNKNDGIHQESSKEKKGDLANNNGIPDSAIAALHKIISEEKAGTTPGRTAGEETIGDRYNPGTVTMYGNRVYISGARIGELCPNYRTRGDAEFGGAPLISCRVTLLAVNNSLWAYVEFKAVETKADWSTVKLSQWVKVRDLPYNITQINSSTSSWVDYRGIPCGYEPWYTCWNGPQDSRYPTGGSLVYLFKIIGDTGGNDISSDSNCSCDTKIYSIDLRTIAVTVQL